MIDKAQSDDWPNIVAHGRWNAFNGLPDGLLEHDLLEGLGKLHSVSHVRAANLSGVAVTLVESDQLRYWIDADHLVLLVELHQPPTSLEPSGLLATMGVAESKGHGRYRHYGAITTEYLYPSRGIALTIAESYEDPPSFEPFLAAVHLFGATDLAAFANRLGGADHLGPPIKG